MQVPPPTLGNDLALLLESGSHSDVTFKVEDESMEAHRIMLTTRSPVFHALLSGDMREGKEGVVVIEDVRAPVFRALLHFVYTDSLPEVHPTPYTTLHLNPLLLACPPLIFRPVSTLSTSTAPRSPLDVLAKSKSSAFYLLATSSIGHVGYLVVGFCCGAVDGIQGLLIHLKLSLNGLTRFTL